MYLTNKVFAKVVTTDIDVIPSMVSHVNCCVSKSHSQKQNLSAKSIWRASRCNSSLTFIIEFLLLDTIYCRCPFDSGCCPCPKTLPIGNPCLNHLYLHVPLNLLCRRCDVVARAMQVLRNTTVRHRCKQTVHVPHVIHPTHASHDTRHTARRGVARTCGASGECMEEGLPHATGGPRVTLRASHPRGTPWHGPH